MGTFRGHMSLKSSPFSPGPSCKLSNQYIIQDHMAAHYKKLMSAKAAVDSSTPKSLHTSVKFYEGIVSGDVSSIDVHGDGLWPKISSGSELLDWVAHNGELILSCLPPGEIPLNSFETSFLFQNSSGVKHQPTFLKHLVGIKPELPLRAKTEGMSQDKDQQKRDKLIQALEKYKKNLVHGLPASPFKSRSVSPSQQKAMWSPLENSHLYLMSGQNNCSRTKREQPPSVSFQKFTSGTLMSAPPARKTIQNTTQRAFSQSPVHSPGTNRSPASPLLHSHMQSGCHSKQNALQNSRNKTYSGDLLDKHSIYFTEQKQLFTPRILKTSHQSLLVKHRYYNPPPRRRSSSPGRSSLKSSDTNNGKKRELHRLLEDAHVRPHSDHVSQQPTEQNHELWIPNSEMLLSLGSLLQENEGEYLRFLQDLTNDILIRSCYHEEALEDVFQMHIKSKRHNLDEVKRGKIVQSLKKELNITNHPDPSINSKDASIPATCF